MGLKAYRCIDLKRKKNCFVFKKLSFQLFRANYVGKSGKAATMEMGCYGIGVTRVMAAALEVTHVMFKTTLKVTSSWGEKSCTNGIAK